ncbi:MAG: hypothetical protein Q7R81_05780 [Candidatus Peregrinibacteria bacterium]|nr:hypothetical protein [Candidatus Peregrinibacteria bacterium]
MNRSCKACSAPFDITDAHLAFYDSVAPAFGGKKFSLPPPTLCPECRQQRRVAQGNQIHLYKRKCDFTKDSIISNYHPGSPYTVYKQEVWWSDQWDAATYGRDFDFSRPFFEQYRDLLIAVPRYALHTTYQYDENSEYINYCTKNKDCYLIFDSDLNRDCYYSYSINNSQNCMDCYRIGKSELSYECVDSVQCYDCAFLQDCQNCSGSMFLKNCTGCQNCLMCSNLRNKEYHIENKPVSKEAFEQVRLMLTSRERLLSARERFEKLKLEYPQKEVHGIQNEDVLGDYLTNCKNAHFCFDSRDLWDCTYNYQGWMATKSSMDVQEVGDCQLLYECSYSGDRSQHILFCSHCFEDHDCYYCSFCMHNKNLFGCVAMSRKEYCILNKQYTKEEYEELAPRIIEHMEKSDEWGEFFPIALASFAYNETLAQDYFPLTKGEAQKKGYVWRDEDAKEYSGSTYAAPDTIGEVPDTVTKEVLCCAKCKRNFRIVQRELDLLRQKNLPLPLRCFFCRHRERMQQRNPRKFWKRECGKCKKEIQTTYAPERPEIVYCESCYLAAVD